MVSALNLRAAGAPVTGEGYAQHSLYLPAATLAAGGVFFNLLWHYS